MACFKTLLFQLKIVTLFFIRFRAISFLSPWGGARGGEEASARALALTLGSVGFAFGEDLREFTASTVNWKPSGQTVSNYG